MISSVVREEEEGDEEEQMCSSGVLYTGEEAVMSKQHSQQV